MRAPPFTDQGPELPFQNPPDLPKKHRPPTLLSPHLETSLSSDCVMGQSPATVCAAGSLTFLESSWPPHPQNIRQDVEIIDFY